jgi:hypothetical protein
MKDNLILKHIVFWHKSLVFLLQLPNDYSPSFTLLEDSNFVGVLSASLNLLVSSLDP